MSDGVIAVHCSGPGVQCMEKFVALLEQYCHPSNNGRWTSDLASFLNYLVKYFLEQLAKQVRQRNTVCLVFLPFVLAV